MFFPLFITFHKIVHAQNRILTLQFRPDLEIGMVGGGKVYRDDSVIHSVSYDMHSTLPIFILGLISTTVCGQPCPKMSRKLHIMNYIVFKTQYTCHLKQQT